MKINRSKKTTRRVIAIASLAGTFQISHALATTDFLFTGAKNSVWNQTGLVLPSSNWDNLSNGKAVITYPGNSTNQVANAVIADSVFDFNSSEGSLSRTITLPASGTPISITPSGTTLIFDTISFGYYSAAEGVFTLGSNLTIGNTNTFIDLNTNSGGLSRLGTGNDGTGGSNTGLTYSGTSGTQTINSNLALFNASSQTWALDGTGEVLLNGSLSTTSGQSVIKSKSAELEFAGSNLSTFLGSYAAQAGTTLLDSSTSLGPTTVSPGVPTTVQVSGVASALPTNLLINTNVSYGYNTVLVTPKAGYQVATLGAQNGATGTSWTGNIQVNDGVTLQSPGSGKSITFSGIISDGTGGTDLAGSGYSFVNSNLVDASPGTIILSGANSYSGSTNVSGGILQAGIANTAFGNNSAILLGNVSGTVLNLANFNQTVGSLTGGGSAGGNINLGSGNLTVGADNTSPAAYAGIISGTGGLTKVGTGTLTLSGSNTYSGVSNINGGVVNLGVAETAGTSGPLGKNTAIGSIVLGGGVLQYSSVNQIDYSGRFSTAANQQYNVDTNGQNVSWATALNSLGGSLTKLGAGTLTLTGASNYSGATTVDNGTLNLGGGGTTGSLNSASPLVLGGGAFVYSNSITGGATQGFAGTTINVGLSSISNTVSGNTLNLGALIPQPGGTVDFTNLTGTVTTTTANSNGILGSWATANGGTSWAVDTGTGPTYTISAYNSYTETSVAQNNPASYSGAFIDVNSSQSPTGGITVANLRFNTPAAETLTLTGTNVISSGGILISPNVGTNPSVITGGTLEGPAGGALFIDQNNNSAGGAVTIGSIIADNTSPTALAKNGVGTLILAGSNTYSGITYVNGGVLSAGIETNAFGNGSAVVIASGAILDLSLGFDATIGSLTGNSTGVGNVTLGSNTLSIGSNNTSTGFGGVVSGAGGVTKIGAGTLTLSGQNVYTGVTNISSGAVNVGSIENPGVSGPLGNQSNTAAGTIVFAGGTLQYSSVNTFDYSGRFSTAAAQPFSVDTNGQNVTWGSVLNSSGGTLTKAGAGTLTLTAVNQYTGSTTINGGTLSAGIASNASGGAFGLNSAVVLNTAGATLNLNTYATTIGSLAGTAGNVTLSSSTLTVGTDNTSTTFAGVISGTGGLTKAGAGTLTLSGANTYSGKTNISGGVISLASAETAGVSGPIGEGTIVLGGGTLQYTGTNTYDYSSRFGTANFEQYNVDTNGQSVTWAAGLNSPGGTLLKLGNGTLTLSTANKYTGATTVNQGTLTAAVQSAGVAGAFGYTSAVTLNNLSGVTLNLNGYNNAIGSLTGGGPAGGNVTLGSATLTVGGDLTSPPAYGGVISGTGGLIKIGSGTLELQASNTYSGPTNVSAGTLTLDPSAALSNATALTVNGTVNFNNSAQTVSSLNGSGAVILNGTVVTVSGGGTFSGSLADGASPGSLVVSGGTLTLSGVNTFTGGLTVTSGNSLALASTGVISAPLVVGGNVTFANNSGGSTYLVRTIPSLNLGGGSVTVAAGSQSTRQLLEIGSAGLSGTGPIDLNNNDLLLQGGGSAGLSQINGLIQQGYITSTAAANSANHLTALGAILNQGGTSPANALLSTFDGASTSQGDVLVKYTYYGDTDLNGEVDGSDYSRIDSSYLAEANEITNGGLTPFATGISGWFNGDFNYDGVVNGSDYTLIDNAFNSQNGTISDLLASPNAVATDEIAGTPSGTSAVPEPTSLGLFGIGALGLLGRRRRR